MSKVYFWIIAALAVCCACFIAFKMWQENKPAVQTVPKPTGYNVAPFPAYITGVGIVEASGDNIAISAPLNRLVDQVMVQVGQPVAKGEVLLRLDDRDLQAELRIRQSAYAIALAQLQRLKALPRVEDVTAAEAVLQNADVEVAQARRLADQVEGLDDVRALSQEEINRRRFSYQQAQAQRQQAQAALDKVKSGSWPPDVEIARLEALQAKANVDRIATEISRTIIHSPINGKVLQVNIHAGEFAAADASRGPLMIVGNTAELCLEVSINQFDAARYRPQAPAVAMLRGSPSRLFPLRFVRLDPYLVSKHNVTQDIKERVDTRVLQVVYCFEEQTPELLVGQQMDVFIATEQAL